MTGVQIIEGAMTIGAGIVTWFYFPDFPDQNKFLTERQTKLVLDRILHLLLANIYLLNNHLLPFQRIDHSFFLGGI